MERNEPLSDDTTLSYPVAKIDGFDIHLERNFFGITTKEMPEKDAFVDKNVTANMISTNTSYAQLLSNLQFVKVRLTFCFVVKKEFSFSSSPYDYLSFRFFLFSKIATNIRNARTVV